MMSKRPRRSLFYAIFKILKRRNVLSLLIRILGLGKRADFMIERTLSGNLAGIE